MGKQWKGGKQDKREDVLERVKGLGASPKNKCPNCGMIAWNPVRNDPKHVSCGKCGFVQAVDGKYV